MLARTRRLLAAALALLVTFPILASCSDNANTIDGDKEITQSSTDTPLAETAEAETETTRADIPDNLPVDLNFNGDTVNTYHFGSTPTLSYDTAGELAGM